MDFVNELAQKASLRKSKCMAYYNGEANGYSDSDNKEERKEAKYFSLERVAVHVAVRPSGWERRGSRPAGTENIREQK